MNTLFTEFKRRNIFRVAGVYAVVGWILMQVVAVMTPALNLPDWVDSFFAVALIIGFPIAVLLAWAFEMTPEGVKRTEAVAEGDSITGQTGRKLDFAILFGLVLVGALVVSNRFMPQKTSVPEIVVQSETAETVANSLPSIAVLPFADLSPAGDQEYFSDGIAEEILNVLVRVKGLSVTSRTSSFQFKGRDIGIPEIATLLKVQHVLEGSVRKSGNTLRITAQLIDTSNDRHLWSDTFDRPLTAENIFVIQDEIAQAIVDALGESIAALAKTEVVVDVPTDSLSAYELFLQARPLFQARNKLDMVDQLLARAVAQDTDFAKAWEIRAAANMLMPEYGFTEFSEEEYTRRAVEYAERALAADSQSATAIAVRANIRLDDIQNLRARHDIGEIIEEFERALAIDPRNGSARNWLGIAYGIVGDLDAALSQFTACVKAEPYYAPCAENVYDTLAIMGRMEEALSAYEAALKNGTVTDEWINFAILAHYEEKLLFMFATNQSWWLPGWRRHEEIYDAWRNIGADHSELVADIRKFSANNTGMRSGFDLGTLLVPLGAYDMLSWAHYIWAPEYAGYRRSDEFYSFIRKSGVFDYWREHGFPLQCRAVGIDDFECE